MEAQYMPNPRISFVEITAREDHPYLGRPDLDVFTPTLETFRQQSMKDFEWIIVDALYEQRKDYFKNLKLPFKVKHVSALPNLWIEKGLPGICTQYNKGIIYADGELLFFTGDSHMVQPNFMQELWKRYTDGYFPLAWYFFDNSFARMRASDTNKDKFDIAYPSQDSVAPVQYDLLGYTGKNVSIEHRYIESFKNNDSEIHFAPWNWWFGCSSASLEAMLKINGFNQNFDGDRMLLDCDVGSRLELAGYEQRFALFRNIFLVRAATDTEKWNETLSKDQITIKCNYPLIWHSRFFKQYKANAYPLTDGDIKWIKEIWCAQRCSIRELCKREHPWQYPFEHNAGYLESKSRANARSSKRWFNFWKEHQTIIDLTQEREKRIDGNPKYEQGTFT